MKFAVLTESGWRVWTADDTDHAREQHRATFPDEGIIQVRALLDR